VAAGSGEVRAPRKRTKHTEPLSLSIVEFADLYASLAALWDMSAQYEQQLIKNRGAGRQWECSVADVMVYQLLINQLRSARAVDRFLQDPRNWK
jgi:flagellar biosynthesis chaperone FliJ